MNILLALSFTIAMAAVCLGVIVTAIYPGVPNALVIALLIVMALRLTVSLFERADYYIRRRARRRRIRGL